jgi:hypothetical protein
MNNTVYEEPNVFVHKLTFTLSSLLTSGSDQTAVQRPEGKRFGYLQVHSIFTLLGLE